MTPPRSAAPSPEPSEPGTARPGHLAIGRADLHVHSRHSSASGSLPFLRSRDCYSSPLDVYRVAKRRGMDLVTITDHDSIDGWRELMDLRPDTTDIIPGEEVSCRLPDGNIRGASRRLRHDRAAARRAPAAAVRRLRRHRVPARGRNVLRPESLLHFYRGQVPLAHYLRLLAVVPALEARNGTMLDVHNRLSERLCRDGRDGAPPLAAVAGSDAHTLRRVGRTWTEAPGLTAADFLASLTAGLGRPGGDHGGEFAVIGDTYGVVGRYMASV